MQGNQAYQSQPHAQAEAMQLLDLQNVNLNNMNLEQLTQLKIQAIREKDQAIEDISKNDEVATNLIRSHVLLERAQLTDHERNLIKEEKMNIQHNNKVDEIKFQKVYDNIQEIEHAIEKVRNAKAIKNDENESKENQGVGNAKSTESESKEHQEVSPKKHKKKRSKRKKTNSK